MASGWRSIRPPPLLHSAVRTVQLLAAYHLFTTCIADLRICSGFSMLPTLSHEGDCVLVSPLPYFRPWSKSKSPSRGDLVVATSPTDPRNTVCKRVIGIEGDVVEVEPRRGGGYRKWIGEEPWEEEVNNRDAVSTNDRPLRMGRRGEGQFIKVPKGHVWLVGDNLSNSTDSRTYGPVPIGIVKAKVLARVSRGSCTWFPP